MTTDKQDKTGTENIAHAKAVVASGKKSVLKEAALGAGIGALGGGAISLLSPPRPKGLHDHRRESDFPFFTLTLGETPATFAAGALFDYATSSSGKGFKNETRDYAYNVQESTKHLVTGDGFKNWQPNWPFREPSPEIYKEGILAKHRQDFGQQLAFTTIVGAAIGAATGGYRAWKHNKSVDNGPADSASKWQEKLDNEKAGKETSSPAASR